MRSTRAYLSTTASPQQIWALWAAVDKRPLWDFTLQSASLDGAFDLGGSGIVQPFSWPSSSFKITECTPYRSFSTMSTLPLGKLEIIHQLSEKDGKWEVEHRMEISGFSSWFFARLIGKQFEKALPTILGNLVECAEQSREYGSIA